MRAAKLALSLARDDTTPRQLGPTSLRPVARAAFSQASAREPAPCPRPAVMMIAAAAPFSPANFTMPGTEQRRCRDHDQIGWRRHALNGFDRVDAFDLAIAGLTRPIDPSNAAARRLHSTATTRRGFAWACAHDRHRPRCKQLVEAICRHLSDQSGRIRARAPAVPHRRRYPRCAQELPTSSKMITHPYRHRTRVAPRNRVETQGG